MVLKFYIWNQIIKLFFLLNRNYAVERHEKRILGSLSVYGGICKLAKEDLKRSFSSRQREVNHRKSLERTIERNPNNRQQIVSFIYLF